MRPGPFALALATVLVGCDQACEESGTICTLVGDGAAAFYGDGGNARDAELYFPSDVTWRPGHDEYVITDWNNERLRLVDSRNIIETVVGTDIPGDGNENGGDMTDPGLPGTETAMNHPVSAEFGPDGRLYIAAWHNHKIRRWDPETGLVRVVVANFPLGTGNNGGYDGDGGPAEDAHVWFPSSIAFDPDGNMLFIDEKNLVVRKVNASDQIIDTVAGCHDYGTWDGTALVAAFQFPNSPTTPQPLQGGAIEIDDDGIAWVADTFGNLLRRVDLANDSVTTVPLDPPLVRPTDVELGPDGLLYVADTGNHTIRAIDRDTFESEVVAGTGEMGLGDDDVQATHSALNLPYGLDFDDDGAMLIADTFNSKIRRVTP